MPTVDQPNKFAPTAKSRRCYHRVISGIERGGQLRFLTLTSSNDSPSTCQRSFRALYMRLKRRGLMKGYIKVPELSKNGKQHLHVLFRGSYIDAYMLMEMWQEIHHAKVLHITRLKTRSKRGIASYMAKYLSKEQNWFRYSWNWDWVWRGFVKDYYALKRLWRHYHPEATAKDFRTLILFWQLWLRGQWHPPPALLAAYSK